MFETRSPIMLRRGPSWTWLSRITDGIFHSRGGVTLAQESLLPSPNVKKKREGGNYIASWTWFSLITNSVFHSHAPIQWLHVVFHQQIPSFVGTPVFRLLFLRVPGAFLNCRTAQIDMHSTATCYINIPKHDRSTHMHTKMHAPGDPDAFTTCIITASC